MCSVPDILEFSDIDVWCWSAECCAGGCGVVIQSVVMLLIKVPLGRGKITDGFMSEGGVRYGAIHFMDLRNGTGAVY